MAHALSKAYLIAYNASLLAGWALVAFRVLGVAARGSPLRDAMSATAPVVKALLIASCMETVHAALGIVRSPVVTTAIQAFVRLFAFTVGMNSGSEAVSKGVFANATVIAWSASEVIRYAFYLSNLARGSAPFALTWLRYSAFIALYPIGFIGEAGSLLGAVPHLAATGKFSVALPNTMNFAFWMPGFIKTTVLLCYPYGSYVMYTYMLSQRKKALGAAAARP